MKHTKSDPQEKAAHFTDSEEATILAALRYWQDGIDDAEDNIHSGFCDYFAESAALTGDEIDTLCESLNCEIPDPETAAELARLKASNAELVKALTACQHSASSALSYVELRGANLKIIQDTARVALAANAS